MATTALVKTASNGAIKFINTIKKFDALRYLPKLANGILRFNASGDLIADNGGFVLKTAAYTAISGDKLGVNTTSGAITITLPASAEAGDQVELFDPAGTWDTNNVTVARNGLKINSGTSNLTLSTEYGQVLLRYIDATIGWRSYYASSAADSLAVTNNFTAGGTADIDGAATIGSVTADAETPFLKTASGKTNTGYVEVLGKTSGGLRRTVADASAYLVTETLSAQTVGTAALTIPDFAGVADEYTFKTKAQEMANKTLVAPVVKTGLTASGSAANDFSGSTGTFATSTGANTLNGATTINDATTPSLTTAAGKTNTGFVKINGKTSGSFKLITADATAQDVTLTVAAQTVGAAAIGLPDAAGVAQDLVLSAAAQTLTNKTLTAPVIETGLTASGSATNDFSASTGAFKTSTGLNTVGGKQALKVIAAPVAATGAGGGVAGAAALGSANIVTISSDGATKGVKLLTGVPGDVIQIINTSGTAANLFAASGGTINGGAADAGCAIPASKGVIAICTAADTWSVFDMTALAGAAA